MLQYTTIWWPSMWHTLPTPCRIAPTYNNCSRQSINSNLSPCWTWAIKASPQSSCTDPGLYTGSTSQGQCVMGSPDIGSLWPFHSGELAQPKLVEARVPWYIHVRDITPHFSQGCLHYVCIMLSSSKTDPFHLGCPVIIGCTGTLVCGACEAWCIIQQYQQPQTSPDAPFLQIDSRALDCLTLVRSIKDIAAQLGFNPSRHSGHSLCIREATSTT